jgi:hypothetical protein
MGIENVFQTTFSAPSILGILTTEPQLGTRPLPGGEDWEILVECQIYEIKMVRAFDVSHYG